MNGTILITGGSGFIGRETALAVRRRALPLKLAVRDRTKTTQLAPEASIVEVGNIGPGTDWSGALAGVEVVIHLAGRAHVFSETSTSPLESFRQVNSLGTEKLARDCINARVRRIVYVSSIGVNGFSTTSSPFTEADLPNPDSSYATSKWEAEETLKRMHGAAGLEVVVVRPPLVYGSGAPGNIRRLIHLISRGIPLPLALVSNMRSFIGVENLANFLVRCADHSSAPGETFVVSDGKDLSTPDLINLLARGLGCHPRLWPFPISALRLGAKITSRMNTFHSLCSSLQIDSRKARSLLEWQPTGEVEANIEQCASSYREQSLNQLEA